MKRRSMVSTVQISLDAERRVALVDLKNGMLVLLATWIAYFVVINFFIQSLNKVTVPMVNLPLGDFLVAQGSIVIFFGALYLLIRRHRQPQA